jgi:SPP1 gp7 family putative phage head morphogenesis protein
MNGKTRGIGNGFPSAQLGGWTSGTLLSLLSAARGGREETLTDPLSQHVWVYACVKARARALASTPLQFWAGDSADAPEITSGPLVDIFRKPHPLITGRRLLALTSVYFDLYGRTHWLLHERDGAQIRPMDAPSISSPIGVPDEICPVPGHALSINWSEETGLPESYEYRGGSQPVVYPAGSVISFVDIGHSNLMHGIGAIEQVRAEVDQWIAAPDRHQKPAVLSGGLSFSNPGFSPRDMENAEMRLWSRDAIMAVFGVTKPILSITDDVNRANAREAKAVFWEETLIPQQEQTLSVIEDSLLSRLGGPGVPARVTATFDRSKVEALGESLNDQLERAERFVALGVDTNKAFELAGMEIDPLTDEELGRAQEPEPDEPTVVTNSIDDQARPEETLNGAQISSLLSIIEQVASGALPKETGVKVIVASFPFDEARAREILAEIEEGSREPEPQPVPQALQEAPGSTLPEDPTEEPEEPEERSARVLRRVPDRDAYARAFEEKLEPEESAIADAVEPIQVAFVEASRTKLRQLASGERAFRPKRPEIRALEDDVEIRALEDDVPEAVLEEINRVALPNLEAWVARFADEVSPTLIQAYLGGLVDLANEIGLDELPTELDSTALAFLEGHTTILAEQAMGSLNDKVRDSIAREMFAQGGDFTIGEMQDRVQDTLEALEDQLDEEVGQLAVRAQRIARTESAFAVNNARVAEMLRNGITQVEWISARDSEVRESHAANDGEIREIGDRFSNGMRWPHDEGFSGTETINCRCTVAPHSDLVNSILAGERE